MLATRMCKGQGLLRRCEGIFDLALLLIHQGLEGEDSNELASIVPGSFSPACSRGCACAAARLVDDFSAINAGQAV